MTLGRVFVDTGAWFALQVQDDEHHEAARQTLPALLVACRSLVTSNLIIGETYTLLRMTKGYTEAQRFLEKMKQSPRLERVFVTECVEQQAYQLLQRYADQPFSFVDATSFALMRQQRMRYAFAFDRHFVTAGFSRIPGELQL
jgi:uncharacterized protein